MNRLGVKRIPGQRGVSPRGATRKRPRNRSPERAGRRALSILLCGLIVVVAGAIYQVIKEPVMDLVNRPIRNIQVEGDFQYLSQARVEKLISDSLDGNFLQLDLTSMKAVLEENAWVERAAVQRQWPDSLRVRIFEQRPIARWGSTGFLNRSGDVIQVQQPEKLEGLPWLEGREDDGAKVMQRYQEIAGLLRARGMTLASLKYDERGSWSMELDEVSVTIGRDSMMDKVQRFFAIYDARLHERWAEVASLDLRYTSGIAVKWKKEKREEE